MKMTSELARLACDRAWVEATEIADLRELESLRSTAEITSYVDHMRRQLIMSLSASFPAVLQERLVVHRKWPATWWDAFKERWFPAWLKKRYPVGYESVDIDRPIFAAACPHVACKSEGTHLEWLLQKQEEVRWPPK